MVTPHLLSVARGDTPADLLLTGGSVVNVFSGRIDNANIAVADGVIAGVGDYAKGRQSIDLRGAYVAPGFIDAHMHVESTFLPPSQFVRLAAPHGTTGAVFDPHEIANVLGIDGIRFLMDDSVGLPLHALFALSSCVPATHLEHSGARLEADDLAPFFNDPRVVALAEVMNFPGVVGADPGLLAKIRLGLAGHVVDGHAPGLRGKRLQAYVAAGITSDHECTSAEEAREKLALGMRIFIREGSAARNLEALLPAVTVETAHRFCFCTDDRHPADLAHEGHIDHIVRKAIRLGMDPVVAIRIASINPASHYRRHDLGAIAPGFRADMIVFDDLRDIKPGQVYFGGRCVGQDGAYVGPASPQPARSHAPLGAVRCAPGLSEASFTVAAPAHSATIRVIGMHPHQLVTASLQMKPSVHNGRCVSDASRDVLKIAVIERHHATGNIGLGFVHGFGLKAGAIASTVGHDSHNLAVVGASDRDMLAAARALQEAGGGQCVVRDGNVLAMLPLPIAGLMSNEPAETVIKQQADLLAAAGTLGYRHGDPFMPLSFLPLAVIPSLKLTDMGLVDVDRFEIVPLEVE